MRFGNTYTVMQYEKLVPHQEVRGKCLDQYHEANTPLKKTDEWTGTHVIFKIRPLSPTQSELDFTHVGLNPSMECYYICEIGWNHFIIISLKGYLENGRGEVYQNWSKK